MIVVLTRVYFGLGVKLFILLIKQNKRDFNDIVLFIIYLTTLVIFIGI